MNHNPYAGNMSISGYRFWDEAFRRCESGIPLEVRLCGQLCLSIIGFGLRLFLRPVRQGSQRTEESVITESEVTARRLSVC